MRRALLLLLLVLGCSRQPAVASFPVLPDTIYTASGTTAVFLVDSLMSGDGTMVAGQYWFTKGHILISRAVEHPKQKRKVLEHERCHVVLNESGVMLMLHQFYGQGETGAMVLRSVVETLCDAFANAAIAHLERTKP